MAIWWWVGFRCALPNLHFTWYMNLFCGWLYGGCWVSLRSTQPTFYLVYEIYFVDGYMVGGGLGFAVLYPTYILSGI